jgi:membrane-associated protein
MVYSVIGGALWTAGITYLGYFLEYYLTSIGIEVDTVLMPIIGLILLVSVSPALYHLLKDKQQRLAIWNATKLEIKKIFGR